jgi:hypothetical protein
MDGSIAVRVTFLGSQGHRPEPLHCNTNVVAENVILSDLSLRQAEPLRRRLPTSRSAL